MKVMKPTVQPKITEHKEMLDLIKKMEEKDIRRFQRLRLF